MYSNHWTLQSVNYAMSVPKVLGMCAQLPLNYAISVYDSAWFSGLDPVAISNSVVNVFCC